MNKNIYFVIMFILGCAVLYLAFTRGASDERKFKEFIRGNSSFSSLFTVQVSEVDNESKFTYLSNNYKENKIDSCQQANDTLGLISKGMKPRVYQIESVSSQLKNFNLVAKEITFIDTHFRYVKSKNQQIEHRWNLSWDALSKDKKECKERLVTASNILYTLIKGRTLHDIKVYLGNRDLIHNKTENTLQSFRFISIFDDSDTFLDYYFVSTDSMLLAYREVIN